MREMFDLGFLFYFHFITKLRTVSIPIPIPTPIFILVLVSPPAVSDWILRIKAIAKVPVSRTSYSCFNMIASMG